MDKAPFSVVFRPSARPGPGDPFPALLAQEEVAGELPRSSKEMHLGGCQARLGYPLPTHSATIRAWHPVKATSKKGRKEAGASPGSAQTETSAKGRHRAKFWNSWESRDPGVQQRKALPCLGQAEVAEESQALHQLMLVLHPNSGRGVSSEGYMHTGGPG